jgi:rubrerythrin
MPVRLDFSTLSLMDALDLATLIEVEAHERYTQFAEQLGVRYPEDAASVFQSMAANEGKHGQQIAERRIALFGEVAPRVRLDDIFDVEAPEVGAPHRNMSRREAFWVAWSAERKAFAFYDQALRHVTQPEVKALFEDLDEGAIPNSEGRMRLRL